MIGARRRSSNVRQDWTIGRRRGRLLRHQTDFEHTFYEVSDTAGSTNPAIRDPAKHILNLSRAEFRIHRLHRRDSTQDTVRLLQPACGTFTVSQILSRDCNDSRQPVQPVRLISRQPSASASALQAARRKIERPCQFLQGQPRSSHQFLNNLRPEPLTNRLAQFAIAGESSPQRFLASQLFYDRPEFIDHSVAYVSAICHLGQCASGYVVVGMRMQDLCVFNYEMNQEERHCTDQRRSWDRKHPCPNNAPRYTPAHR